MPAVCSAMPYPATVTVHTPNGPVDACDRHAGQLRGLMNMMGAHVVIVPAPANAECSNCVNVAEKRGER